MYHAFANCFVCLCNREQNSTQWHICDMKRQREREREGEKMREEEVEREGEREWEKDREKERVLSIWMVLVFSWSDKNNVKWIDLLKHYIILVSASELSTLESWAEYPNHWGIHFHKMTNNVTNKVLRFLISPCFCLSKLAAVRILLATYLSTYLCIYLIIKFSLHIMHVFKWILLWI